MAAKRIKIHRSQEKSDSFRHWRRQISQKFATTTALLPDRNLLFGLHQSASFYLLCVSIDGVAAKGVNRLCSLVFGLLRNPLAPLALLGLGRLDRVLVLKIRGNGLQYQAESPWYGLEILRQAQAFYGRPTLTLDLWRIVEEFLLRLSLGLSPIANLQTWIWEEQSFCCLSWMPQGARYMSGPGLELRWVVQKYQENKLY